MSRRRLLPRLFLASGLCVPLAGCAQHAGSHIGAASTTAAPEVGVAPDASVGGGASPLPHPAWLGDVARRAVVGRTLQATGVAVEVMQVRSPMVDTAARAAGRAGQDDPPRGTRWVGVDARTCFRISADRQLDVGTYLWAVVGTDGIAYPATSPATAVWPLPQYPGYGRLAAGACTAGWLVVAVPDGVAAESIVLSNGDGTAWGLWSVPARP